MGGKIISSFLIVLSLGVIALVFQNCSQSASFQAASNLVAVGQTLPNGTVAVPNGSGPGGTITTTPSLLQDIEISNSAKIRFYSIQNNSPVDQLYLGEVVYGIVSNVGNEDSWGCADYADKNGCADKSKWAKLPFEGWKYVPESRSYIMSQNLDVLFVSNREFVMFFEDRKNGISLSGKNVMLPKKIAGNTDCHWIQPAVPGPTTVTPINASCSLTNAWQRLNNSQGFTFTCACSGVRDPYANEIEMGRISGINMSSKAFSYYDIITGNPYRVVPVKIGDECVMGQGTWGRLEACDVDNQGNPKWLGEAPNRYIMCPVWTIECTK